MYDALRDSLPSITERQRQVIELIAAGCSNEEVGERLGISPRTAKAHSDVLRQKLGVTRRRQIPVAYRALTGDDPLARSLEATAVDDGGLRHRACGPTGLQARSALKGHLEIPAIRGYGEKRATAGAQGEKVGEATALDTSRAGRRIIERPRLTRLLTDSESRVMLLVAPAGYGKTTLAREWLRDRKHVWYQATPASSDVAALALGLADAAGVVAPTAPSHVRAHIKAAREPATATAMIATRLAAELEGWPRDTRFVIDDYHLLGRASQAESLIETLVTSTQIPFLIASRERPTWLTAKKLLYGEAREFGRTALAMTHEEAATALSHTHDDMPGLVSLAEGWPAVIGLAALVTEPLHAADEDVPETLHEFFAEELYQGLEPQLKWSLTQLSMAPSINERVMRLVFGDRVRVLLEDGYR